MYLLGLPTNVPEKKWGARLIEHLTGEAEEVVEFMSIEEITKDNGWKLVFKALDEKYKELDKHELQRVMKEYFYTINIKEGESYRNFIIRLENAYKGLVRHEVTLPDEVKGWMLLRRIAMDATAEAMLLTPTSGSLKYAEITKAVRSVFPHGKATSVKTQDERDLHGQRRG